MDDYSNGTSGPVGTIASLEQNTDNLATSDPGSPPYKDTKTVSSFQDLANQVFEFRSDRNGYWLFRGDTERRAQSNEQEINRARIKERENLTPIIGRTDLRRYLHDKLERREFIEAEELNLYEAFTKSAHPHVPRGESTNLEWLAIARHHGLPTRLLDWSESLFIAAYFAVARVNQDTHRAVVYATNGLKEVPDPNAPLTSIPDLALYRPPHISPRITAQRGVFTVHQKPKLQYPRERTVKLTLAGHTPITYKMNLHHAGINQATLFPDLGGIAEQLLFQYKWDQLPPYKNGVNTEEVTL